MKLLPTGKKDTDFGYEITWANTDSYCGKMLIFEKAGNKSAMSFHKSKRKSWFVNSGRFKISYIDVTTGYPREVLLEEGKTVDFAELSPHKVEALADYSVIFEAGTSDYLDDRFLLTPDDSKKQSEAPAQDLQSFHHHGTESERT